MCAAFTDDIELDCLEIINVDEESEEEGVVSSVIQYYSDEGGIRIGRRSELLFGEGHPNIFRSFKRHIADFETEYSVYQDESQNPYQKFHADQLCEVFLQKIYENAVPKIGRKFDRFVFTHPTLFSSKKLRAFKKILDNAGFSNYELLDEAIAAALNYISNHQGKYGLVVYDFGGGTIDITYLHVDYHPASRTDVMIVDAGGLPDFGGDDVTDAAIKVFLEKMPKDGPEILTPDSRWYNMLGPMDQKQAGRNNRLLLSFFESLKKNKLFKEQAIEITLPQLRVRDPLTGRCRWHQEKGITIHRGDVYRKIYKRIQESVEIIQEMLIQENGWTDDHNKPIPQRILLSGYSSKIPIVKEMFNAYREEKRPFWDEKSREVIFSEDTDRVHARMECEPPTMAVSPKACVATGAAWYYGVKKSLNVTGHGEKTRTRFGMLNSASIASICGEEQFDEWIPRKCYLIPKDQHIASDDSYLMDNFALGQREWRFTFTRNADGRYFLTDPIRVYEHLGRRQGQRSAVRDLTGIYTLEKPAECPTEVDGILRLEYTEDLFVRVRAKIIEKWYDVVEIEVDGH